MTDRTMPELPSLRSWPLPCSGSRRAEQRLASWAAYGESGEVMRVCRNIRPLFNLDPTATEDEVRDAALQFVRKISGFSQPSRANEAAFYAAVEEITAISARLLGSLETSAAPRNREELAARARARAAQRFGR